MDEGVVAIVKSLLDEEEIDYYIVGEFSVSKGPDQKLMVRKDQAERAREILEDLEYRRGRTRRNSIDNDMKD